MLGSVLGQCLAVPGIIMKQLQNRFSPALQPVHTLELVEVRFNNLYLKFRISSLFNFKVNFI